MQKPGKEKEKGAWFELMWCDNIKWLSSHLSGYELKAKQDTKLNVHLSYCHYLLVLGCSRKPREGNVCWYMPRTPSKSREAILQLGVAWRQLQSVNQSDCPVWQINQSDCPVRGRMGHFKSTGSCGRHSFPFLPLPLCPTFVGMPVMQAKSMSIS